MLTNMKSLLHFGLMCAFFVVVAPLVSFAARDDVSLESGVLLTVGGLSFTVRGSTGALLDSISVDSNSLTLTMSPDTRFQISSADRRTITPTALATIKVTHTCSSSESVYLYENPSYAPSGGSITLTIDSGTCNSTGSSGGSPGGGGGGGSAYAVSSRPQKIYPDGTIVFLDETGAQEKVIKLDAKFAVTAAPATAGPKASISAPAAVSAISGNITRALSKGTTNPQVKVLQQILNSDPATRIAESGTGSPGNETDYFGPSTQRAVQKFQVKYSIAKPGDSGYGNIGPLTRTILNSLAGKASNPDQQIEDAMKQIKILQDQLKNQ